MKGTPYLNRAYVNTPRRYIKKCRNSGQTLEVPVELPVLAGGTFISGRWTPGREGGEGGVVVVVVVVVRWLFGV